MSGVEMGVERVPLLDLLREWRERHGKIRPAEVRTKKRSKKIVDPKVVAGRELRDFLDLVQHDLGATHDGSPLVMEQWRRSVTRGVSDKADMLRYQNESLAMPLDYEEFPIDINLRFKTLGIYSLGDHAHFTLRPGPKKIAKALNDPKGFADYMRQRLRHQLHREFGHPVNLLFVVECKPANGDNISDPPHLQGVIGLPYSEADRMKRVLRTVGGPYDNRWFEKYKAVWVAKPYNLFGWMGYNAKSLEITSKRIEGNPVASSQEVTREAKSLYAETRTIILSARKAVPAVH